MKKIIKKILKEDRQEQFLNKIILLIKDEHPIFNKLEEYGFDLSEKELVYVFSGIFEQPVTINKMSHGFIIYDENGNQIYNEFSGGEWYKYEYDEKNKEIYKEDSEGYWRKSEYDENGNMIYYENSNGVIKDNR